MKQIKIIYYIDKIGNESFSELNYKSNYLEYICDFLEEKKEGSLYSLLTNGTNYNIKSINFWFDVILKSKIQFNIYIELNCLKNINDIIFITYQYMNKIINEAIGENLDFERYKQKKDICYRHVKYQEKTFDSIELANNNGEYIFRTKYNPKILFYYYCIPWKDNFNGIKNESKLYFNQIRPENSVIIFGLRDKDRKILTCNDNSPFSLNCSYFLDDNNIKNTTYYNVTYIKDVFNSSTFEKYLDINNTANITLINNSYISKHNESLKKLKKESYEYEFHPLNKSKTTLNKFYFKRNVNFIVPKVYISLNLFHPYLRPNNTELDEKKCYYFKILEIFTAIKRKINEELSDAIRADNEIDFGLTENYLFINTYCFEDICLKIMEKIRNIIYNTSWEETDFISNNQIYKNETFEDFFIFDNSDIQGISRYYLYCQLKNSLFNKYEFFPEIFEAKTYAICNRTLKNELKILTSFIIKGTIYGYYKEADAEKIYDLFDINHNISLIELTLDNIEISDKNITNYFNWIIKINKWDTTANISINISVYNKSDDNNDNLGISYLGLEERLAKVSLLETLLNKTKGFNSSFIDFNMIIYGDIFFELMFYSENKNEQIPNNTLAQKEWENRLDCLKVYNDPVDNIGNRYYYVKKNFELTLIKKQTSLKQRARDEIMHYQNEGIILEPGEIYKDYQKEFNGKKTNKEELNELIDYFKYNFKNWSKLHVQTIGKKNNENIMI